MPEAAPFRGPVTRRIGHRDYTLYGIDAEVVGGLLEGGALDWIVHNNLEHALFKALKEPDPIERTHVAMGLMGDVWASAGGIGAYPFVETLADLEHARTFHPNHRDHVVHQLRVFLLGLWIRERCPAVRAALEAEPTWGATDDLSFHRRWVTAALFHDIGYLFEALDPTADVFIETNVAGEIGRWIENPLHLWLARGGGAGLPAERERKLASRAGVRLALIESFPELFEDEDGRCAFASIEPVGALARAYADDRPLHRWLELCKGLASMGRPVFWDHGLCGAALLLRLNGHLAAWTPALSAVLDRQAPGSQHPDLASRVAAFASQVREAQDDVRCAAAAIALHNLDPGLWNPDQVHAQAGLDLTSFGLSLRALPIPFLLRLADTLQDWERPAFNLHRKRAPLYDQDVWLQPWQGGLGLAFPSDGAMAYTGHADSRFGQLLADTDRGLDKSDTRAMLHERPPVAAPSAPAAPALFDRQEVVAFEQALLEATVISCEEMAFFKGLALRSAKPVLLDDVYVPLEGQVAISPGGDPRRTRKGLPPGARERELLENTEDGGRDRPRSLPLDDLLGEPEWRCWALLGAPGAGKTTLLRHAALRLSQRLLRQEEGAGYCPRIEAPPLPMFLALRDLWRWLAEQRIPADQLEPGHLVAWMAAVLAKRIEPVVVPEGYLEAALESGRLWLLFDAVDEVPGEEQRAEVVRVIRKVASLWKRTRLVLTARTAEYTGSSVQHLAPQLPVVTVAPLSPELRRLFCERWTRVRVGEGKVTARGFTEEQYLAELLGAIGDSRLAQPGLVDNPLLLTAVAVVYDDSGQLPEARAQLYQRCSEVMVGLRSWADADLGWPVIFESDPEPVEKLGPLLLAARAMQEARVEDLPVPDLRALLEGLPRFALAKDRERQAMAARLQEQVETRSGLLVCDPTGSKVRFVHRTFQEYLCARAMAEEDVGPTQVVDRLGPEHLDRWWRQALVFVPGCYSIDRAAAFVGRLLDRAAAATGTEQAAWYALAAECLAELPALAGARPALLDRLEPVLADQLVKTAWPLGLRAELGDALGRMGRPRVPELEFVLIPGGRFWMGAQKGNPKGRNFDPEVWEDESPVHEVGLSPFEIARFPVTVGQYAPFVAEGYAQRACWCDESWAWRGDQGVVAPGDWQRQRRFLDRPVVGVSWYEARAFAAWITARRGDGFTYALPGEAQWERAARGRKGSRRFPWGDALREGEGAEGNFNGAGLGRPSPVGLFPAGRSEEGVEELAGNVWEWTADLLRCYPDGEPFEDKEFAGLSAGDASTRRVMRGGSWDDPARGCRVSYRGAGRPSGRWDFVGLRLVRSGP